MYNMSCSGGVWPLLKYHGIQEYFLFYRYEEKRKKKNTKSRDTTRSKENPFAFCG